MGTRRAIQHLLQKKVQGGALYIAIIISIIIGIILTMFILVGKYNQRNVTVFSQSSQLNYNLTSAFEIAKSDYFTAERNNRWFKNISNDDSLRIKKLNWGAYLLITAETKNRHQKISQSGLFGTWLNSDTALYVADNSRPVGLSGKIVFKGNCYLPKGGIKPAYIEGQSYISSPGTNAFIKNSSAEIPILEKSFRDAITEQQKNFNPYTDSVIPLSIQKINHPFHKKTIVLDQGSQKLSNLELFGNIKILGKIITIDNSCKLENILLVCEKVIFKEGFKGSVHVIASDSIIVEKKCELMYPSSFVISAKENEAPITRTIIFNEDSKFSGGIIAFKNSQQLNTGKVFVKLHAKSEINGSVYSEDYVHVEGLINGNIISHNLLLKTPSAVYENHILACEIDPKKYAHILVVPILNTKKNKLVCCKNLQ
jgi:hypothetical protein